ncbi:hypothetical protein RRG08_024909 [Elysia crispata]|uniref:Uncharacterized protein n=1 Tax=Elysia crispata TaxID=231223 RepID=A0AAE1DPM9_9GAST|nr:hypothetical protein RRG08_024909 [Elysia crispata]
MFKSLESKENLLSFIKSTSPKDIQSSAAVRVLSISGKNLQQLRYFIPVKSVNVFVSLCLTFLEGGPPLPQVHISWAGSEADLSPILSPADDRDRPTWETVTCH